MKNKIKNIFKILVITAGCLMFASFSPSLDGRAVVVENGVFPQGLFAKTVGYLPGDIISVTNIAGDTTIDLLVIGALDPSEGVAIMLSPEAAQAMGIDKGSNNIVKITKRSGQDERVYGNAVISKSSAEIEDWDDSNFDNISAEENTEAFDEAEKEAPAETEEEFTEPEEEATVESEPAEEEPAEEAAEESVEEPAEELSEEPAEEAEEEPEAEETIEEEAFEDEAPIEEETFEEENIEETPAPEEDDAEAEEYSEEAPGEIEEEPEAEAFDDEELNELPAEENEPEESEFVDDTEIPEETPEDETVEEDFEEETPAEKAPVEEAEETEEAPVEEETPTEESFDEEAFEEETPEELPAEEKPAEETFEEAPAEEAFEADELETLPEETKSVPVAETEPAEEDVEETETDEYEAIVLVPVDSNPPESDEDEVEDVVAEDELETIEEELTPVVEEPNKGISEVKPVITSDVDVSKSAASGSYDKYMVPSLKDLESGKYYIQIAVYASDDNILDVISKYGSNYPITIVPMAGGNKKQILIGPVSMDEYKVVLERFKSYGFKDAFLRKVK